jgi:tetratricopeptide (TPR) repeat protein
MLFDLKGRRKRFIQVSYVILAFLFGIGLIGFGIGGATSGGLFDAIGGGGGGGGASDTFEKQVKKLERSVRAQPANEKAWAQLARAEYQVATTGEDYDNQTGTFKEGALDELRRSARAWERYLELKPKKPDATIASIMVQVYGTLLQSGGGIDAVGSLRQAARAQEIVAEARPSPIAYFNLASIEYLVGRITAGDRAADEAVKRTPKDQRNTVRAQIDEIRARGLKIKRQTKKSEKEAASAAKEAAKSGQDPFGAAPGGQVQPNQ